jgi:AbrB family looped-hinge helix DNA binding protein
MPVGTLTSKGQITLPKEVRDRLGLEAGSRIDFVIEPSGRVMLRPMSQDFRSLRGIVKSRSKRRVSLREMDEAIARGFSGS